MCTGHDYSAPDKPKIDWDDPEAKNGLVSALVNDATSLVNVLADNDIAPKESEAVALLALVAGQDVEPAEGSDGTGRRWRIAHLVAEDRVISTVDTEARHTRKSSEAHRDVNHAQLVAAPGTGPITDEELTQAAGPDNSDPAIVEAFLANDIAASAQATGTRSEPTPTDPQDTGPQADPDAEPGCASGVAEPGRSGIHGADEDRRRGGAGRAGAVGVRGLRVRDSRPAGAIAAVGCGW